MSRLFVIIQLTLFLMIYTFLLSTSIARGEITHDESTGVCQFAAAKNPQKINPSGKTTYSLPSSCAKTISFLNLKLRSE